jgi:putative flippase GtrA
MASTSARREEESGGHMAMIGQLGRFAVSGGLVTALGVGVYWAAATWAGVAPLLANLLGYAVAMVTGYVMHSRWSFRGHGSRDNPAARTARFFIVSLVSLGLNSLWVWLATGLLGGPTWWPVPLMLLVTPLVTFTLNRRWVFA